MQSLSKTPTIGSTLQVISHAVHSKPLAGLNETTVSMGCAALQSY